MRLGYLIYSNTVYSTFLLLLCLPGPQIGGPWRTGLLPFSLCLLTQPFSLFAYLLAVQVFIRTIRCLRQDARDFLLIMNAHLQLRIVSVLFTPLA